MGAYIDKGGKLKEFSRDIDLEDNELSKEIVLFAVAELEWNFSCLKNDVGNYYFHTQQFTYYGNCMVTLQISQLNKKLKKLLVKLPETLMVFYDVPDTLQNEINVLTDYANEEYQEYLKKKKKK